MSADKFANDLTSEFEGKEREMSLFIKTVALDALAGVVRMSPVDSGRFRGNWDTSIGHFSSETFDTTTAEASVSRGEAALAGFSGIKSIYLSNSLPYAEPIENGHSGQAPAGVVAVTVANIGLKYSGAEI